MVGYVPEKKVLPSVAYGTAGAVSGVLTRAVCQPFDVIKIRFQVQVKPITKAPSSKYHGIKHAINTIYKEEGIRAFWKGHVPAQALSVIYGVVQFASFEYLTKGVWDHLPRNLTTEFRPLTHFVCGGIAGSIAAVACQPCDVLRTRFITQGQTKVYLSITHACKCMLKEEGLRSFYRGLVPSLLQVAPHTALQFGIYTLLNRVWKDIVVPSTTDQYQIGSMEALVCGSGSGFCSKLIIYPLDLTKKRLQIQGFEKGWSGISETRKYNGFMHCCRCVVKEEGFVGLYKGLSPSLMKAVVVSAVSFWSYEQIINMMEHFHDKKS